MYWFDIINDLDEWKKLFYDIEDSLEKDLTGKAIKSKIIDRIKRAILFSFFSII